MITDILLDNEGDLFAEVGDSIGDARWQVVWQLLRLTKGGLTHAPWLGCNLTEWVQSSNTTEMKQEIKLAMRKASIELTNNELNNIIAYLTT